MSEIKINEIEETVCKLYDPEGNYIGEIKSYLQLADVRIQIMRKKIFGYHIIWKDDTEDKRIIRIDKYGNLEEWPPGFFDIFENQLDILLFESGELMEKDGVLGNKSEK